jgi:hypothetical protein
MSGVSRTPDTWSIEDLAAQLFEEMIEPRENFIADKLVYGDKVEGTDVGLKLGYFESYTNGKAYLAVHFRDTWDVHGVAVLNAYSPMNNVLPDKKRRHHLWWG